ncbi:MAG TPA: hypothetical protein VK540_18715 [Polyangiaceae bacterium]|nr:hypothetical protein [Polyangiaceae bacterium]
MTVEAASRNETVRTALTPRYVQQVALLGVVAVIFGRSVAPALRGARAGLDRVISYADLWGGVASYLFAFIGLSALIVEIMLTFREKRFSLVYRVAATVLGLTVVSLVAPAFREPLPERANIVAALASGLVAVFASYEAMTVPRTRALGVLLVTAGTAALLHLGGTVLAWYAGEHALYRAAAVARLLATASVLFDTIALLTGFAWLTTRTSRTTVWGARVALFVACVLAWGAARGGPHDGSPLWQIVTYRAVERILAPPPPYVWIPYRYVLETCAPLLGVIAVFARGQMPAVIGALTLALIARPTTDVPLSALALTLAALSTPLAARDDRGMWAVLMANSGQSAAFGPNSP